MRYTIIFNKDLPIVFDNMYQLIKYMKSLNYDDYITTCEIYRNEKTICKNTYSISYNKFAFFYYTINSKKLSHEIELFRKKFVEHNNMMRILNHV